MYYAVVYNGIAFVSNQQSIMVSVRCIQWASLIGVEYNSAISQIRAQRAVYKTNGSILLVFQNHIAHYVVFSAGA